MKNPFNRTKAAQDARRIEPVTGLAVEGAMENPYIAGKREWNERYGSYVARARTWQLVAMGSLGLAALLGMALVHQASQSKVQPFIVEVDKLGQAVAVRPAEAVTTLDERIVRAQLANYVASARNVTPDPMVQKRWLDGIYAVSGPAAVAFLNDHYQKTDPFKLGTTTMVSSEVQPPLKLSEKTWQVQWAETRRGLNGQVEGITRWQAIFTVAVFPPTTAQQILANPTGLVIEQLTWTQQL